MEIIQLVLIVVVFQTEMDLHVMGYVVNATMTHHVWTIVGSLMERMTVFYVEKTLYTKAMPTVQSKLVTSVGLVKTAVICRRYTLQLKEVKQNLTITYTAIKAQIQWMPKQQRNMKLMGFFTTGLQ